MILRLDPRHPMLWRTPSSLQFGADPTLLRLDEVTQTQERLLAALAVGVGRSGLTMIAGGREDLVDRLLAALEPVLSGPPVETGRVVSVSGTGPIVRPLSETLQALGVRLVDAPVGAARPELAVLVHGYVIPPTLHGMWLRRDVAHLPVVLSDGGVSIGPLVEPGAGPCLLCIELHRRDADRAWPAIAAQLLGRTPPASAALALEAAALAARTVLDRLDHGPGQPISVRIDAATGERQEREWLPHPECGCRGIEALMERELAGLPRV